MENTASGLRSTMNNGDDCLRSWFEAKRAHGSLAAIKFEILNPKHETKPNFEFSDVQNRID